MLIQTLDRAFVVARSSAFLYRFTLFTRVLLAAGFVPTGMVKALGHRFTSVSPDTPIGAFFEAMFQTGMYWRFLGLTQVVAGVFLLVPRLAHLGAAIFLPIMLNIFIVTVSMSFRGTPLVTGSMLLATAYLCLWDYHRFRPMLTEAPFAAHVTRHRLDPWEAAGFTVFGACLLAFFSFMRGVPPLGTGAGVIGLGLLAGLFTLGRFVVVCRAHPAGRAAGV